MPQRQRLFGFDKKTARTDVFRIGFYKGFPIPKGEKVSSADKLCNVLPSIRSTKFFCTFCAFLQL